MAFCSILRSRILNTTYMDDCVFCKIASKSIDANLLHEDYLCVIFRDIHPKAPTHLLIVSKKHIPSISEMEEGDEKIVGHLINSAKNIAKKLSLTGYQLQFNVGKDGGQEIFHLHLHLMSNLSSQ